MTSSYKIANKFLCDLAYKSDDKKAFDVFAVQTHTQSHPPTATEIPVTKPGWGVEKDLKIESPFYSAEALVHFVTFSNSLALFCHAFDSPPNLLKPEIIQATWLHLHIAILLACHQQMFTAQALQTLRVMPVLHGLEKQPQVNFPLAYAALNSHLNASMDDEDLPF